jgi:hypothetical protein
MPAWSGGNQHPGPPASHSQYPVYPMGPPQSGYGGPPPPSAAGYGPPPYGHSPSHPHPPGHAPSSAAAYPVGESFVGPPHSRPLWWKVSLFERFHCLLCHTQQLDPRSHRGHGTRRTPQPPLLRCLAFTFRDFVDVYFTASRQIIAGCEDQCTSDCLTPLHGWHERKLKSAAGAPWGAPPQYAQNQPPPIQYNAPPPYGAPPQGYNQPPAYAPPQNYTAPQQSAYVAPIAQASQSAAVQPAAASPAFQPPLPSSAPPPASTDGVQSEYERFMQEMSGTW